MCNCRSYNTPKIDQTIRERVMQPPFMDKTVCVDSCIVKEIQELWDAGFETLGCCCGHNKEKPSVIVDKSIAPDVSIFLGCNSDKPWRVLAWKLVEY